MRRNTLFVHNARRFVSGACNEVENRWKWYGRTRRVISGNSPSVFWARWLCEIIALVGQLDRKTCRPRLPDKPTWNALREFAVDFIVFLFYVIKKGCFIQINIGVCVGVCVFFLHSRCLWCCVGHSWCKSILNTCLFFSVSCATSAATLAHYLRMCVYYIII